jgi:hypothetical protein
MKKALIGLIIGIGISIVSFLVIDFFSLEVQVPKNHVTVRLFIETEKSIDKITLTSSSSNQTITLSSQIETILTFPSTGEGEFGIVCIFKNGQELHSQSHYVESGYCPKLIIKDNEIETIEFY